MSKYRLKERGGWWYRYWTEDGKTRKRALKTRNEIVARQKLSELNSGAVDDPTVGQLMTAYLYERDGKIRSIARRREAAKPIIRWFGHLQPMEVTQTLVDEYGRFRGVGPGTLRLELSLLRTALNWGMKHRHISAKPYFELPPSPPTNKDSLTPAQAKRLLAACETHHVKLAVLLGLHTGCRLTSAMELRWAMIDWQNRIIDFGQGHGRKRRGKPPINDTLYSALRLAFEQRRSPFVIEYGGRPVGNLRQAFKRAALRAGLRGVSYQWLRHTFISWAVQDGVDLFRIARYVGNTVEQIDKTYGHLQPGHLVEVSGVAERAMR